MAGLDIYGLVSLIQVLFIINHARGESGIGYDSTSHEEGIWSHLKHIINNIYYTIPSDHFILYLKEAEFRRNINPLNPQE